MTAHSEAALASARAAILALAAARGPDKSLCPSEAARALASAGGEPDAWRGRLPAIRAAAAALQAEGALRVLQKGADVEIGSARGPIRLAAPRR